MDVDHSIGVAACQHTKASSPDYAVPVAKAVAGSGQQACGDAAMGTQGSGSMDGWLDGAVNFIGWLGPAWDRATEQLGFDPAWLLPAAMFGYFVFMLPNTRRGAGDIDQQQRCISQLLGDVQDQSDRTAAGEQRRAAAKRELALELENLKKGISKSPKPED